jgi:P4 family phage/plasmid primase-like protien
VEPFVSPTAEPTEDTIAATFTARYQDRLRFDHDLGSWFEWTGDVWHRDHTNLAAHFARLHCRVAGRGARAFGKAAAAAGVERFARNDPIHAVRSDVWDRDPLLLGTPSGTVDLRTGELIEPRASDFITKSTKVAPDRGVPRLWLQFLHEALRGDEETIRYLQQWAGYCLTGLTSEHALAFLYGGGGNGKSVTIDRFVSVLGDYAVTAAMETFAVSKGERHSTELAMLRGARLVTASETEEGRAWNEARVKQMTGGDRITARFMRQDNFTFQPQFKLLIAGNYPPVLSNVDDAIRRRFNIIPFVSKPNNPDPHLSAKLAREDGKILQWMIEGCLDWQRHGLVRPSSVQDATADYFDEQDVFGQWLADRCEVDLGNIRLVEVSGKLFADWQQYAAHRGEPAGTQKSFAGSLARRGVRRERKRFRGAPQRLFAGISLKGSFTSYA